MMTQPSAVVIAFTTAPTLKPFQYIAHYRPDHDYSPFHQGLDAALKCFYGKGNLSTVLLKKELLRYENLHLIDHAVVDVWPNVVMVTAVPGDTSGKLYRLQKQFSLGLLPQSDCAYRP